MVEKGDKNFTVFLDKNGKVLGKVETVSLSDYLVTRKDGNVVIKPFNPHSNYERILETENPNLFIKEINNDDDDIFTTQLIDKDGNIIYEVNGNIFYSDIKDTNTKLRVSANIRDADGNFMHKIYYIDEKGNTLFEDKNFSYLSEYPKNENELIVFGKTNKSGFEHYGYMTTTGEIIIESKFDSAYTISENIGLITECSDNPENKSYFVTIDKENKSIKPFGEKYYPNRTSGNISGLFQLYSDEDDTCYIFDTRDVSKPILITQGNVSIYMDQYLVKYDDTCKLMDLKGNILLELPGKQDYFVTNDLNDEPVLFVNIYNKGVYMIDLTQGVPSLDEILSTPPTAKAPNYNVKPSETTTEIAIEIATETTTEISVPTNNNNTANNSSATNTTTNTTLAPTGSIKYKVQKWDTLGNISLRNYGSYAYHQELYKINRDSFAKTKGKLVPGMEIILPEKICKATRLAPLDSTKGKIHTVKSGETLGSISNKYYKTPSKYNIIFNANKDRIKKANVIYEGQQILIPNIK